MSLDIELFRHEIRISEAPLLRLSAIDIAPERYQKTLVLIHGFAGKAEHWEPQLTYFSDKYRVIALELRGHGQSDAPHTDYTMAAHLADITKAFDVLNLPEKFILAGHSFGVAVCTEYALLHPDRLEKLILLAGVGEYKIHWVPDLGLRRFPVTVINLVTKLIPPVGAPAHVLATMHRNTVSTWIGWDKFKQLTTPTLVIRGDRDWFFEKSAFEKVAPLIKNAQEVNVGSSGHKVMLERTDAVNRAIKGFITQTHSSWRETLVNKRTELQQERPWLTSYNHEVPYTIGLPRVMLPDFLRSATRRFPLKTAIVYYGKKISYRRLNREANRFANALKRLGIKPGDRVMILLPNIPQTVVAFFGALKAGAVVVMTTPLTSDEETIRQLQVTDCVALVTFTQKQHLLDSVQNETPVRQIFMANVKGYLQSHKKLAFTLRNEKKEGHQLRGKLAPNVHRFLFTLYSQPPSSATETRLGAPDDLAVIQFTSGTTSAPKGVMLTHRNLVANTIQTRHWMATEADENERFLSVLPVTHSYGLLTGMIMPVSVGATIILLPRFDVTETLQHIKKWRPTIFPGIPGMYVAISEHRQVRKYDVKSIRACISGSSPLHVEVQESFEKLTRGRLVEGYGLTEASPVTHANPLYGKRKAGFIGVPIPSTEARIIDLKTGQTLPENSIGELVVRGPQVMQGYWRDQAATDAVLSEDGWLRTGDIAQMDSDGYFQIIARKQEMWYPDKSELPYFPRDIEEVLYEIPQVREAVVITVGNRPVAFITAGKQHPTPEQIIEYCKRRLPPNLVPVFVVFVSTFPRTFIGKIVRRELRKKYQRQIEAAISVKS